MEKKTLDVFLEINLEASDVSSALAEKKSG
jgi:hypothetical protein